MPVVSTNYEIKAEELVRLLKQLNISRYQVWPTKKGKQLYLRFDFQSALVITDDVLNETQHAVRLLCQLS
jgi:hypothetical protein